MRLIRPLAGFLILVFLVAIPVGGTPNLQNKSYATYDLSSQISFDLPICWQGLPSTVQPSLIACPMGMALPLATNITGTLGWNLTNRSGNTAVLNVTKDVTISHDGLMVPDVHVTSSFNESIDLATRAIISIMPFLTTEMDTALQIDQATATSTLASLSPNFAMNAAESAINTPQRAYTMWWMNETLHQGQNVTILVFPTKVVSAGTFDFQGKPRSTWDLIFNKTLASPQPMTDMAPGWTGNGSGIILKFEYDQNSGLLLSATADINVGFLETMTQSAQCALSTSASASSTTCNSSTSTMIVTRSCGFSIHASLALANTSLNLDQTLSSSGPTSSGGNSGPGPGGNSGSSGSSGGTSGNNGGYGGSGGSGGNNGGSNPGTNSGGTPLSTSTAPASGIAPWIYLLLAAVIVAIVAVALWIARKQSKKNASQPK